LEGQPVLNCGVCGFGKGVDLGKILIMDLEKQFHLIAIILGISILLSPVLIIIIVFNKQTTKNKFLSYMLTSIIITSILMLIFGWWGDKSDMLLLEHYGYNIDGNNDKEIYGNVLPKDMERVKSLETSIMGIGWPLKVIMCYVFYLPYLFVVYLLGLLIRRAFSAFAGITPTNTSQS
jgi:hypothetical protein